MWCLTAKEYISPTNCVRLEGWKTSSAFRAADMVLSYGGVFAVDDATGLLGAANAAVFLGHTIPEPQLRAPVPSSALFATDTSGGLFDALENFRRVNNGMWLELDAERAVSPEVARSLPPGVEKGWALVGGVGEYELLFAVPTGMTVADAVKIGRGGFAAQSECDFRIIYGGKIGRMSTPPPDYRAIKPQDWLGATAEYWASMGLR